MKTKVEFIKDRYYKGKKVKKGDILVMSMQDAKTYINFNAAKLYVSKKKKPLAQMTYKELQELAKKNDLPAVGKREDLLKALRAKKVG